MNNCHEKIKKKWEDKWADICRKIRCWSDRSFIINGIIFLLLIFLVFLLFAFLFLLLFFPEECCVGGIENVEIVRCLFGIKAFNFVNIGTAFGGLVTLLLYQRRNQAIEKQTKKQYETFNKDKQFSNYLKATKLLTGENSTTEAKIAAMFSLADVTKDHPEKVGRVIQVINQELIPFKKNIESYTQKTLKEWRYKGDGIERTFSTALYIIRKIILGLPESDSNLDISQTILFDIDIAFDKNYKNDDLSSIGKNKRIEDLIFCYCKLENVNFSKMNYHTCKFIRCNLKKANFYDANLWGTSFIGCDLEETEFKTAECEGAEFENCKNLTLEQLDQMKFKNHKEAKKYCKGSLKYLIVINEETREEINKSIKEKNKKLKMENFITRNEYDEWKNSAKIDNDYKNKKS